MSNRTRIRSRYGVTDYAWRKLRDCEKILHKWSEDECNGRIQWDDETGEPHLYRRDRWGDYTAKGRPTFNFEDYALDRARKTAQRFGLKIYHQSDPRGCALYVYRPEDLNGSSIESVYSTQALAIC